jgi:hypothetical protein
MFILQSEIIGAFATGVIGPVIVVFSKHFLDKRKNKKELAKKDPISEVLKSNIQVESKISEMLEEYGANRVWINQFHNGGNFYPTGKSIHKFSMFYEVVSPNTHSIKDSFQNIPVSLFSRSINRLLEEDIIEIPNFDDENITTYGLCYVAGEYGTKSSYEFAIKSIEGKFIGILGIDFTSHPKILTPEQISDIRVEVTSIGGVLVNHILKYV